MSYTKAMKHWKNHRKDKNYQQCAPLITSNPSAKNDFPVLTPDGEYIITAYCYDDAVKIAIANGLTVIERN